MIRNWFTCVIKYQKATADGEETKVTESYLVNAMTYTEAEARILHVMSEKSGGMFFVDKITKSNFHDVFDFEDADLWFKVKVSLVAYDDETEKEKQTHQYYMVAATDIEDAFLKTKDIMKGALTGYVVPSITYTKILEVFPYSEDEREVRDLTEQGYVPMSEASPEGKEEYE